jgi:hypothetical protein
MPEALVFPVALIGADRDELTRVVSSGTRPARMIMRARVLLALDGLDGSPAERVVVARQGRGVGDDGAGGGGTVCRDRGDAEATITRKRRVTPPVPSVITGDVEARLIALACSTPPPGRPAGRCGCSSSASR